MKKVQTFLVHLISLTFLSSCGLGPETKDWAEGMQGMAQAYEKLFPYMYDSQRYADPNNKKFISLSLNKLNENASSLSQHTGQGLSGNDPLFEIGLKGLKLSIRKSMESYFVESHEFSQNLLQASVNYCNTCHSRTNMGPTFMTWDKFKNLPKPVQPMDQAKMAVATRQFPKAISILQSALVNKKISKSQDIQSAIQKIIFVSLKNLESPQKAHSILKSIASKNFSKSLKRKIYDWKKSLYSIANKKSPKKINRQILTNDLKKLNYVEATQLSLQLHKYLNYEVEKLWRAKAYHFLGKIYEQFPSMGFWNLPETYYETCIDESPGTKTAQQCYFSYEGRLARLKVQKGFGTAVLLEKGKLRDLKFKAFTEETHSTNSVGGIGGDDW